MQLSFELLPQELLTAFCEQVDHSLLNKFHSLQDSELSIDSFSFYTSVSAVFSSKIEGESIDLDSYIKHKRFGIEFLPDYTRKIDDLYDAYQYAKANSCNKATIEQAHRLLTAHILPRHTQGRERTSNMYVTTEDGRIEYIAAPPSIVSSEMDKFYRDLEQLRTANLSLQATFYYAALLHIVFVKIHPFDDGNGRTARLIEKWFLAEKLGEKAWLISSEKNYYLHHSTYYKNIRLLGLEYEYLDYQKAMPFLLMLPTSLGL